MALPPGSADDAASGSDDVLIAAAVRGDAAAFGRLVERHQSAARRLAAVLAGPSEADDIAQDAFIRAYRSLGSFRIGSPFKPWLLRIVANQASNHRRGTARRTTRHLAVAARDVASHDGPVEAALRTDDRARLTAAIRALPDKDRRVLAYRYLLDLTEEETAIAMDIPRGTVKSRASRSLEKLRLQMGPTGVTR